MTVLKILVVFAVIVAVGGCSTRRETSPQRTATEQLLISAAADRAADRVKLDIPPNAKVFVDAANFDGLDAKYAIAAMRERMLKLGANLVADRGAADVVVEIRAGALSIDEKKLLVGIPEFNIPIPLTTAITVPEIALFRKAERKGVAKFAGVAYDAKDGKFTDASEVQYGFSHETRWVFLLFISWETGDYLPEDAREPLFDVEAVSPFEEEQSPDEQR
jgi:hypothetical protein